MDIGSCLARNARRHPEKGALICEGRTWTYGEMNAEVNRLAHGLMRLGVTKGQKVAMMMKNSDWFAITFYAAAKLGAVLVPMNFRLTAVEVAYILEHSDAMLVVCDEEYAGLIASVVQEAPLVHSVVVAGENVREGQFRYKDVLSDQTHDPEVALGERDELEILYTSGTTGKPKGVVLDHHRVMQVSVKMMAEMGLNPSDRLLHLAPLFHAAQLNLCLLTGIFLGCVNVIHRDFDPRAALAAIHEHRISFFFGVPAMYNFMLQVPDRSQYDLSTVTRCSYGAAPMAPALVRQSMELFGTDQFYNLCGLTEGGPGGIALRPDGHKTKLGASGTAMFLTEARVVDEYDRDVPPGVIGELVMRGETIMKGYYKNPEATAEAMRGGWLHTGDLAVMDEDGYMTLVDRKKDMIISGGENIYSVEVEQVLYSHPAVLEAAIIGVPDPVWGETVAAIIVPKPETTIDLSELQAFCRTYLAGYKIPRVLHMVKQLPRNASGKILKYKLRDELYENGFKNDATG
ncbi:UNVERIFIED_CONTAM: acyl-CoA synthetase (AMP-forming)/AMP-acid ligase II [Brevibacillus sp. OAP136]